MMTVMDFDSFIEYHTECNTGSKLSINNDTGVKAKVIECYDKLLIRDIEILCNNPVYGLIGVSYTPHISYESLISIEMFLLNNGYVKTGCNVLSETNEENGRYLVNSYSSI